jgi:hypothetical protein
MRAIPSVSPPIVRWLSALGFVVGSLLGHAAAAGESGGSPSSVPDGYYVDLPQAFESRPTWRDRPGDAYTYSIRRGAPDSAAARLLGIAEALYPPRGLMIALAANRYLEMGSDTSGVPLWWCDGPGLRRVPYAVTAGAYEHYATLIDDLKDRTVLRPGAPHPLYAAMQYLATIAPRDSFVSHGVLRCDVHVANLTLVWSYDDGVFYTSIEARRTVVLGGDGAVLDVDGDGGAREEVSISQGIGIGRHLSGYR